MRMGQTPPPAVRAREDCQEGRFGTPDAPEGRAKGRQNDGNKGFFEVFRQNIWQFEQKDVSLSLALFLMPPT